MSVTSLQIERDSLKIDNEALRKENDKLKATNARAVIHHIESICEVCAHCMGEDGCANCINKQLAAAEAKVERLKSVLSSTSMILDEKDGQHLPVTCGILGQPLCRIHLCLSEPTSTSLTNYIREQTDEVVIGFQLDTPWPILDVLDMLKQGVEHLLITHDCDHIGHEKLREALKQADVISPKLLKAIAKLKIRNEPTSDGTPPSAAPQDRPPNASPPV